MASLTDPDGIATTYTYDAAHRLTDITDAEGDRLHYMPDVAGRKTAELVHQKGVRDN
jgi:YD repeat-containing protein